MENAFFTHVLAVFHQIKAYVCVEGALNIFCRWLHCFVSVAFGIEEYMQALSLKVVSL
jgi:hypothetical protein